MKQFLVEKLKLNIGFSLKQNFQVMLAIGFNLEVEIYLGIKIKQVLQLNCG
jgi:hypothetical protein